MSGRDGTRRLDEAGLTIVEVLIYIIIASLVMATVYRLMVNQSMAHQDQREVQDVRETLRGAAVLLNWDLRQLAPTEGDIYTLGANGISIRSMIGGGVLCARHATMPDRYGIYAASGWPDNKTDSALVFVAGGAAPGDDAWVAEDIKSVWDPVGGGVQYCDYAGGATIETDHVVDLKNDIVGGDDGSPIRYFRPTEYGIYQEDGRWWFGRKVAGAASWEKLTGPVRSQADGGLEFSYFDATGAVTATPADVRVIEFVIRGESFGPSRHGTSNVPTERQDSVRTRVFLRG
jgi:hypothetical protein